MVAAMWFDAQAALKDLDGAEKPRSITSTAEKRAPACVADVASVAGRYAGNFGSPTCRHGPRVANVADVAGGQGKKSETSSSASQSEAASPYGASPGGRPLTWTGRVVSLEAWRTLTEWEKHGPKGRVWNGRTQRWE